MHAASRLLCALGAALGYLLEPVVATGFDVCSFTLLLALEVERWIRRRFS